LDIENGSPALVEVTDVKRDIDADIIHEAAEEIYVSKIDKLYKLYGEKQVKAWFGKILGPLTAIASIVLLVLQIMEPKVYLPPHIERLNPPESVGYFLCIILFLMGIGIFAAGRYFQNQADEYSNYIDGMEAKLPGGASQLGSIHKKEGEGLTMAKDIRVEITRPKPKGSVVGGAVIMIVLSVLLFWLPLLGPFIAGLIGGKKAGGIGNALLAVFLPGLIVGAVLFITASSFTGVPIIGAIAGTGGFVLSLVHIGPLLLGAIIGGAFA